MNNSTILYRQIHPTFIQNGRVTSQAFKPTPKDEQQLSTYDGDMIDPCESFLHYTTILKLSSLGVMGISIVECLTCGLQALPDPDAFPEHVLISYASFSSGEIKKISKNLRNFADIRDWLYKIDAHKE